MRPPTDIADEVLERCNKPVIIGEFHFGALDRGLLGTGLRGVATQQQRGAAYRNYVEAAAAHPAIVGTHYFQLNDQHALGRFDGECWNIGFVDVCLKPYEELGDAARVTHERIHAVMDGSTRPHSEAVKEAPKVGLYFGY